MQVGSEEFLKSMRAEFKEIHDKCQQGEGQSIDGSNWAKKLIQLQNHLEKLEEEKRQELKSYKKYLVEAKKELTKAEGYGYLVGDVRKELKDKLDTIVDALYANIREEITTLEIIIKGESNGP